MPNLNSAVLLSLPIQLPDFDTQRSVAHIIGAHDDKIDLNDQMTKTLEATARAIFKSWFVDFDPVRAKVSGEPPESICRRLGLTPDLLDLLPSGFVDSELGELPDGWLVRGLDTVAALETRSTSPGTQPDEVFEHYSIPAFDASAMPTYELGSKIKSNKYVVSPLAVLVSKLNPETPRVWLPAVKTPRAVCSTEFMQFVPRSRKGRAHLYLMMCSDRMQAEILRRVTGSTGSRQRAQPSQIATLSVLMPTEALLESFDGAVAPLLDLVAQNREQSQVLAAIRDTLLPKLMSRELRIPLEGAA
jgi:type I restriction enzyme S subunit